jgi:glyoxylase-like metal-dependent hydrolase (beta-lactamase superfamily II)
MSASLYRLVDSCNVYLIVDGEAALAIDAGSGAILGELDHLGIGQLEWVLHTHHHRDQCWGTPRLRDSGARVAVPEYERHLFDKAELYWQTRRTYDNYNDRSTSFTVGEDIQIDAVLEDYESFEWRGYRFDVMPSKGHTLGSVTLIAVVDGRKIAFTGDLMASDARLANLHAMEYNYGCLEGLLFTLQSIRALRRAKVELALPSHGEPISDVAENIDRLEQRIMDCVRLGGGMKVGGEFSQPAAHFLPEEMHPISRHLLWGGVWTCSNFYVILSDSGKALFIDYGQASHPHMHVFADHEGLETLRFVEHRLDDLRNRYGVTEIDLVIPTHIHDDHTCGIPYLQRHHGTSCWALDKVAEVLESPAEWASTPCLFPRPIHVDRRLADGERFHWEEYEFEVYHAPGQTEFHSVLCVQIDGQKVAFTGDNYFLAGVVQENRVEQRPYQTTVLRNSFQLAMHRRCAEVMRHISPELICPGHGELLPCAKSDIDAYCDFIAQKERVFRELVAQPADHYIDLFWARLLPYLATVAPQQTVQYRLLLRNNLERVAMYGGRLLPPPGWTTSSAFSELVLGPGATGTMLLEACPGDGADTYRRLVTAEIHIDGETQGPVCEALVSVTPKTLDPG